MRVRVMSWNLADYGKDPKDAKRHRAIEALIRRCRPDVFIGQELFVHSGELMDDVATRFAAACNMKCVIKGNGCTAVQGNHARHLGLIIMWRDPIQPVVGSWRVITPDRFWHAFAGITLQVGQLYVDHWVHHGQPRVGREGKVVEPLRIAENQIIARTLTDPQANPFALVCGDWNAIGADRTPTGYYFPNPVVPRNLPEDARALARSRAPGEVFWQAGLRRIAACWGGQLPRTSTGHMPPRHLKGTDYGRRHIDDGYVTPALAGAIDEYDVLQEGSTLSDHLPFIFTYDTNRFVRQ